MEQLKHYIAGLGADLSDIADLTRIPADRRMAMPNGIAIGLVLDRDTANVSQKEATMSYHNGYAKLSSRLDEMALRVQDYLTQRGYAAIALTFDVVQQYYEQNRKAQPAGGPLVSHKTIAALSGFGWIGKNTLLVTVAFGSAVRLTSVLTDAPLEGTSHSYHCRCGSCRACMDACPGAVITGRLWTPEADTEALIDTDACSRIIKERGQRLGVTYASCGICMSVCPFTQRYLQGAKANP